MYKQFFKRIIDLLFSIILLILTFPFQLIIAFCLLIAQGGSPFFTQQRPGKNARIFRLIKFKTMNDKKDESGKLLPDKERLTRVGRWVRASSMDELPQLFNVLMGDMSLIGPRPLLVKYLPLYNKQQARRHEVRPGITGWAQVNGRNAIGWEKKFELDVWYVDNVNFALDIKILWMTFLKVVRRKDISSSTSATMEAFKGSSHP